MKRIQFAIVMVFLSIVTFGQTTIIPQNSSWKYLDNGTDQGTNWRSTAFSDTSWTTGNAELGYGDGGEATVVSSVIKPVTTYFRKTFSVPNPSLYSTFTLSLLRDDGAVVYLNGVEVARSNMPTGTIINTTLASSEITGTNETAYTNFSINPSLFVVGNNVLSIELHQATTNNIDLSFNLKLTATTGFCGTPISLNATSVTATSATLNWSAVPSIFSYTVQYRPIGNAIWSSATVTTNSKALTGLNHSTTYEFQVKANCLIAGGYSASATFTTVTPTCAVPTALVASNVANTTATLSWAAVAGATSYNIQYRKTGTTTWTTTTATTATKSLTGLTAGSAYDFQVQAVCLITSAYSAIANFTTIAYSCGTPTALTASAITTTTATISWSTVSGATSYNIQGRVLGTTTWTLLTSNTASLAVTGLTAGTTYEFQVQAVCAITSAYSSLASFTTISLSCGAPTSLNTSAIATTSATLSWMTVSGVASYNIRYRKTGTTTWTTTTATTATKSITGLLEATAYEFQVQSVCAITSAYSALASFTTLSSCGIPSALSTSAITTSSATLSWASVAGATSYNIQYRPTGTATWTTATSTTNSKSITNLLATTSYEFQVQALCSSANAYSASANFTTSTPSCDVPSALVASNITTSTAVLSWQTVVGATSYNIQYRPTGTATWTSLNATTNTINLSNLLMATNYEFQVQALCIVTSAYSASANFTTSTPTCDVPTALIASNITTASATLSWMAVSGATGYNMQYKPTGTATWTSLNATTNTINLSNLLMATNYEFQVQALCMVTSAYSASVNFTTAAPPCSVPSSLTASNITTTSATLSWLAVDGATGYTIQYRKIGTATWNQTTAATTSTSLIGLLENSNYEFQVQAVCVANSNFSSSANFTTLTSGTSFIFPAGTTWKYLDNGTDQGIAWRDAAFNDTTWASNNAEFGYGDGGETTIVNYGTDPINKYITTYFRKSFNITNPSVYSNFTFDLIRDDGAVVYLNGVEIYRNNMPTTNIAYNTLATIAASGVDETTWYTVSLNPALFLNGANVLAVEMHQQFPDSSDLSFNGRLSGTISAGCSTPDAVTISEVGSTSATISWQAVTEAVSYNIQYRPTLSSTWTTITSNTNTKTITGLTPTTRYEFQLQTVCSTTSPFGAIGNFSTNTSSCNTPTNVTIASNTASTIVLNWLEVEGATSYNIQYQLAGSNSWITTASTTNSKMISGLIAATAYEFRVQAVCAFTGDYSSVASFTTYNDGTDTFIAANSTWKYLDNGTNQGTAWRDASFNDAAWASNNAELGYGDGDERTVVSYGPDANNKYLTTYFRKSFTVLNPAAYTELTLGVVFDDGVVVYLNGNEVYRANMPTGIINYNTPASVSVSSPAESAWNTIALNSSLFLTGTNVLTAEVHQQSYDSSDLSFNARLTAPSSTIATVVTRGAYLQKLNSNGITIRWRTDIASNSQVQYGTSMAYGTVASNANLVTEHEVTLTGLTPNTKYFYSIGTTSQTLQGDLKNNFITAPVVGSTTPVRIWGIGDFGTGSNNQLNVRNSYMNYTGTTPTNIWMWLGDNAYTTGTDSEFQDRVFNQYTDQFKNMAVFPTPGNHDYNETGYQQPATLTTNYPYFSIFSLPQNGECGGVASGSPKYYSFNYANIHFISIDSYGTLNAPGSPMHSWLTNDLAANTQRWTIVFMHYPPYTYGTHNSDTETTLIDMRTILVPLLESYHVDLVLTGHSHVNERSYLIKGHYDVASTFTAAMKVSPETNNFVKTPPYDGTVYAVCGTSGQNPEVVNQPGFPMPAMYFSNNTNNCSLVIDVDNNKLSCKYLASTGAIVDDFSITKIGSSARNASLTNDEDVKDTLNVFANKSTITLDYTLNEDSEVSAELINLMGEIMMTIKQIPNSQSKGSYNFEVPTGHYLADGFYFIRMVINGKPLVKKVYVMK
ncbi:fibronectin type III domain-containing protein [Flavobacterium sp.]|uniref:fibronectin type III domain-containing protein n=1 Tax=Flavobacterium sp. TaxID=239 RepID=UPI00286BA85F|nr:fibronectin type III domain-containing protein [Flavobacterium sp.]